MRRSLVVRAALSVVLSTTVAAGTGAAAGAAAGAAEAPPPDAAAIGDRFGVGAGQLSYASSGLTLRAGPDHGRPSVTVDPASGTVAVTVTDSGRTSVLTLAWPLRTGTWYANLGGTEPEQTVQVRRGATACTVDSGNLVVHAAEAAPDGGVAALSADLRSSLCGAWRPTAQIRIGGTGTFPGVPRAEPALLDVAAPAGRQVTQAFTVTNVGAAPWAVRALPVGRVNQSAPALFAVAAGSDTCSGAVLPVGGTCAVTLGATAPSRFVQEHLVIAGDGAADLGVPLRLEGHDPVPAPAGVQVSPGRTGSAIWWDAPAAPPRYGYRVYDVAGGARTLVATAPPDATSVMLRFPGPRSLVLVAAISGGRAESADVARPPGTAG